MLEKLDKSAYVHEDVEVNKHVEEEEEEEEDHEDNEDNESEESIDDEE